MERISGIYKITCVPTGKVYIGQSCDIYNRWYMHKWELNKQKHVNKYFQRAWNKYEENAFVFEIIEFCDEAVIDDKEKYYINFYQSTDRNKGFNLDSGGNLNKKHSQETKEKIRQAQLGEKSPLYQKPLSKEHKEKISKTLTGIKRSNETIAKLKDIKTKAIGKSVVKYSLEGQVLSIYDSLREAGRQNNIDSKNIALVCKHCKKTAGGFQWRFGSDKITCCEPVIVNNQPKAVSQFSLDGKYIATFSSASEAEKVTKISKSTIADACKGRQKTSGGYIWKYEEVA